MTRHWLAVASADHVRVGRANGFMQVCHGKAPPLRRICPGDAVVYYSPTARFGERVALQAFTAMGTVLAGEPYEVDMGNGFRPFRREVRWFPAEVTPIASLVAQLELCAGKRNWGYQLRFGLIQISEHDFCLIATAMNAQHSNFASRSS